VIAHEAVGVAKDVIACDGRGKHREEALAVKVVDEDHLTPVAAGGDMIERAREFQSKRPCHTETLARKRRVAQDVAARIRVSDSYVVM
jgi:hypothetical protein